MRLTETRTKLARFVLAAAVAGSIAGCSSEQHLPAKEYFDTGNEAMRGKTYDLAIDQYQKLLEEHPFSDYAEEAQLKIAYAQFLDGRYTEAIASFQDFQRMHPTNANLAFAEYYVAQSFMEQVGKKARDRKAAENAAAHYQAVIDRFPTSAYAAKSKAKLVEAREVLAGHELFVAQYYVAWENPTGAEARLRYLLENYPETNAAAEALATFAVYFRDRGDVARSAMAYASLIQQYPRSDRLPEAREALAELKKKNVPAPDRALYALLQTLGRPRVEEGEKTAVQVDTSRAIR
jgi:outer membrane protein assembly factor BamD